MAQDATTDRRGETSPERTQVRTLVLTLGDQLDAAPAVFDDFDAAPRRIVSGP